ncbi:MAG: lysophospholipid acyltransferase family protein [Cyclobacteriaceae bacterium]|nr:lysophospholipid acyltransferase family protein [Cyclobacteriaceae bacterium]MCB0499304.1 lysophospholipid acyltransferase family protein [Cyclobacteriaceae bacterium]MCB9236382.1 lysophospholipid acyltransferase family protein [Flammeovirgaceae bacterium]MCO5272299.1 lysophospholipid acyltransferase family protein [Cyclobacteriaceae bacterium]MCW5902157.1 lysophospholipid acyltransferase family protein [Cyclobacteriaceae bacterium]
MLRPLYLLVFKALGWKIQGAFPPDIKKYIVAVGPHTSNWDFMVGLAGRSILRIQKAKFLGKSTLFKPPFGWVFRMLGGYPVDRSQRHDMVAQVASLFASHDEFVLAIAPEGTRKKVEKLRTGFYYIAKKANIPIVPVGFDYGKKEIVVSPPLYPTGDFDHDMALLLGFYRNIVGKNPELGIS